MRGFWRICGVLRRKKSRNRPERQEQPKKTIMLGPSAQPQELLSLRHAWAPQSVETYGSELSNRIDEGPTKFEISCLVVSDCPVLGAPLGGIAQRGSQGKETLL